MMDEHDMQVERNIWPWIDDESHDNNYDDYNDFHDEDENEEDDVWGNDVDDSMDGDFDSAMRDAGWGTDEDYGCYGEDY